MSHRFLNDSTYSGRAVPRASPTIMRFGGNLDHWAFSGIIVYREFRLRIF